MKYPEQPSLKKPSLTSEIPKETLDLFLITCYLKTQNFRFKAFALKYEDGSIHFMKKDRTSGEFRTAYQNSYTQAHVRLGGKDKCSETNQTFYSVVLVLPGRKTRAIYFVSKELQQEVYTTLL